MSITDNQLDNLTHTTLNQLAAYGVILDSDLACDLNELLSSFICGKCDVDIEKCEGNDVVIQIAYDIISGSVDQQVKILNSSYDEDKIVSGLRSGVLATTTCFEQGSIKTIFVVRTGEKIAEIISQEINAEYDDYR